MQLGWCCFKDGMKGWIRNCVRMRSERAATEKPPTDAQEPRVEAHHLQGGRLLKVDITTKIFFFFIISAIVTGQILVRKRSNNLSQYSLVMNK